MSTESGRRASIRAVTWSILLLVLVLGLPHPARAQLPHLDPIPWHTPADSTSRLAMVVDLQRFTDAHTDWNANRILLTAVLPAGDDGTFFIRMPHVTFDNGGLVLQNRWPWVIGPEAPDGWPSGSRLSSFGQLEVGVTGPVGLPLLGVTDYAVLTGLPSGSDRIYPFSSASMPLRIGLRKSLPAGGRRRLTVSGSVLKHMGSGDEKLADAAYPSGHHLGAALDWFAGRGGRVGVGFDFHDRQGRISQLVAARVWIPWTEFGAVGLEAARELAGTLDRPAAWYFTMTWRLNAAKYRSGREIPPTVVPGTAPDDGEPNR